jgi:RHS repeat-associated protein
MAVRCRFLAFLVVGCATVFLSGGARAVWPLPPYSVYPCNAASDPNACYSCNAFNHDEALQIKQADRSSRSYTNLPMSPYGICQGFHDWCIIPPTLGAVSASVGPGSDGAPSVQFTVPYDFPDNYCLVWDTGGPCQASNWPIPNGLELSSHLTRLLISDGTGILVNVPAVFENGVWKPTLGISCDGKPHTYEVRITNTGGFPECASPTSSATTVTVSAPSPKLCIPPDREFCPLSFGGPVNVGSGDVGYSVPLFTIAQAPLSLSMSLTYHSGTPRHPALVTSPIAAGWTHTFAQTLRPVDAYRVTLYRVAPTGLEEEYEVQDDGTWKAVVPGERRGTIRQIGAQYQLTDLDGTVTAFDVATGRWFSTTDRWGNTLTGSYSGNDLNTVRDAEGRQLTLSYVSSQLTQITLPDGQTWRLAYPSGQLAQIFDPLHTGSAPWRTLNYGIDSTGALTLLTEVRDEGGFLLEGHTYDTLDRGTSSVSEAGRSSATIEYDTPAVGQRRVTSTIDANTNQVSVFALLYQKGRWLASRIDGNCASCSGASSDTQIFTYDGVNDVLTRTDGNGHVTSNQYDSNANVISKTEAKGTAKERTATYRYDYAPWPRFRTEIHEPSAAKTGAEKVTRMSWNTSGEPETMLTVSQSGYLQAADPSPTTYTSVTTFDPRHRVLSFDGPRTDVADVTTGTYYTDGDATLNRRGRLRQVTDAMGLVTSYDDYDVFGTARAVTDPNAVVTLLQTDGRGRVTTTTNKAVPGDANEAADYNMTSVFDGRDRLTDVILPRGNRIRYRYEDGTNRLVDMVRLDFSGNETERHHLTLNAIGDSAREEDQACASPGPACSSWVTKRSEAFVYDVHNRLSQLHHPVPAGSAITYRYDPDGILLSLQDENHTAPNTLYAHDALDRLLSVMQALASAPGGVVVTSYAYDVMDNLVSVTDPNVNVTTYRYDDFRRMQRQTSPVSGVTTHSYDPAGNLTSSTDARGATSTRTYDAANRPLSTTWMLAAAPTETVTYAYDDATAGSYGKGRLATMSDPSGSTSYRYERRGLLRQESRTILGDSYTTAYRYDANGNRSGLTYPSGRSLTYGFDFADRPQTLGGVYNSLLSTYVTGVSYLPFGPEQSLTYGTGIVRTASYDPRYRPAGFAVTNGGSTLAKYEYGLDAVGNITAINDTLSPGFSRNFGYDDLYRLTLANGGQNLWGPGSYVYDPLGNRLSAALGSKTSTYTYQPTSGAVTSRLQSVTENGVIRSVQMDAAGNETAVGPSSFVYSARNHLDQGDGLRYVYDGTGLRVGQVGISVGPVLTLQPKSAPVCPGASATLTVRATGSVTYQWQLLSGGSWQDIAGATSATLSVSPSAVASYRTVVSNGSGSTISDVATVTPTSLGIEPLSGGFYGDLNRSGTVDSTDVFLLKEVLAGNAVIGAGIAASFAAIDLNGDGRVDAEDLSLLTKYVAGGITCLPQIPAPLTFSMAGSRLSAQAKPQPLQAGPNPTQYFFYTPEKNLMEETEVKAGGGAPSPAADYIWFNGHPVAQEKIASQTSRFTFTDHLGTPFLQTDLTGTPTWRAEYEPFGMTFTMRTGNAFDQRLRFPGQEYGEEASEREYNIFRWYRLGWGRFTQEDPLVSNNLWPYAGRWDFLESYSYANNSPVLHRDPFGLTPSATMGSSSPCGLQPRPTGQCVADCIAQLRWGRCLLHEADSGALAAELAQSLTTAAGEAACSPENPLAAGGPLVEAGVKTTNSTAYGKLTEKILNHGIINCIKIHCGCEKNNSPSDFFGNCGSPPNRNISFN